MKFLFPTDRRATAGLFSTCLGDRNRIAIPDPVYPVYVDTNVMAGHTGPADATGRYEDHLSAVPRGKWLRPEPA